MYSLIPNDEDDDMIIKEESDSDSYDVKKKKDHFRQNSDIKTPNNSDIMEQITNDLLKSKSMMNSKIKDIQSFKTLKPEDKRKKQLKIKKERGIDTLWSSK